MRAFLKAESNSCVKATIRRAKRTFLVHQAMGFPLLVAIDVQDNEVRDTKHAVWHYRRDNIPIEDSESADPCAIAEVAKKFCFCYLYISTNEEALLCEQLAYFRKKG